MVYGQPKVINYPYKQLRFGKQKKKKRWEKESVVRHSLGSLLRCPVCLEEFPYEGEVFCPDHIPAKIEIKERRIMNGRARF